MSMPGDDIGDRDTAQGRSPAQRAYQGFTWGNRLRRLWASITGGTKAGAVVVAASAVGIAAAPALLATGQLGKAGPERRAAPSKLLGTEGTMFTVKGRDAAGRAAEFEVIVIRSDTYWVLGSTTELVRRGQTMQSTEFRTALLEAEIGRRLKDARELIAVGLASAEGAEREEEARALERARTIAGWLAAAVPGKAVWTLNLGQYKAPCDSCETAETSWQRPLMVVGVRDAAEAVDLAAALGDAMDRAANLPARDSYSRFEMARLR